MQKSKSFFPLLAVGFLLLLFGISFTIPDNSNDNRLLSRYKLSVSPSPKEKSIATLTGTRQVLGAADESVTVRSVIDGNTLELSDGKKVRYIGINAPESGDVKSTVYCFAKEALEYNKGLVEGKHVRLVKDVSDTDQYGRLLRYVYLLPSNPTDKELFVNEYLVRRGYARVSSFPPDVSFQNLFQEAERDAKTNKRGLWASCMP